jgi:iron complex transport system substrate-binding protein
MTLSRKLLGLALAAGLVLGGAARAEIRVVDDNGRAVVLEAPARRILSLAPHATELLFAAGAGDRIVGTVEYSDYPEAARRIPRVGNNAQLDLERIVALDPDLVVIWLSGNAQQQLDRLIRLGIPVFYNEPRPLDAIARSIEQLGRLAGTEAFAARAAQAFGTELAELRARYAGRPPVRMFYQVWDRPLMTVNGDHLINELIELCGGRNLFARLKPLVPLVSIEAVLEADPEAIGAAVIEPGQQTGLESWRRWPRLTAVVRGNFIYIPADLISRPTPRILEGARRMCAQLDAARAKREKQRP